MEFRRVLFRSPLLLVPLEAVFGWRVVFVALGIIGLAWAVAWRFWYHDRPADQLGITPEEVAEIGDDGAGGHSGTPWRNLFALPQLWLISGASFFYRSGERRLGKEGGSTG